MLLREPLSRSQSAATQQQQQQHVQRRQKQQQQRSSRSSYSTKTTTQDKEVTTTIETTEDHGEEKRREGKKREREETVGSASSHEATSLPRCVRKSLLQADESRRCLRRPSLARRLCVRLCALHGTAQSAASEPHYRSCPFCASCGATPFRANNACAASVALHSLGRILARAPFHATQSRVQLESFGSLRNLVRR